MITEQNSTRKTVLFFIFLLPLLFFTLFYLHQGLLADLCFDFSYYGFHVCRLMLTVCFVFTIFINRSFGLIILTVNFIWSIFSQSIHGTLSFTFSSCTFCAFLFCAFYAGGAAFDNKLRKKLLGIFSVFFCTLIFFWALVGIYVVFSGHQITHPDIFRDQITLSVEGHSSGPICSLSFFGFHRNISASFFVTALGLTAYQWFSCKNRFMRIPVFLAAVTYYITIALQHSRSNYLAASVCAALWIGIGISRHFRKKTFSSKLFLSVCIISFSALIYSSFTPLSCLISSVAQSPDNVPTVQSQHITKAHEPVMLSAKTANIADSVDALSDGRKLSEDISTLNGRTDIWKAVIPAIRETPGILLIGTANASEMEQINKYLEQNSAHMHNTLLQQLMSAGLPGFLLYAIFLVFLLIRMLKVYFNSAADEAKSLICLLAAVIVYGVFEPALNRATLAAFAFFLFAGAFSAEKIE